MSTRNTLDVKSLYSRIKLASKIGRMSKILINEINEQAACIARLVQNARPEARRIAQELKGQFEYILVTSRGSSENAGRYAQYLMQTAAGYPVALTRPSIYTLYERPPQLRNALMLGISQSGASPDLLAVFREARAQGRPTVLITNTPDSPMAQISDYVLDLNCGKSTQPLPPNPIRLRWLPLPCWPRPSNRKAAWCATRTCRPCRRN